MVRTRYAPSPTGQMHIGNLRTALFEYLIAKHNGGRFILRVEDTDQERIVEGAIEIIYKTLEMTGLKYDEGPDIGGPYEPYIQSERKSGYLAYAKQLVEMGKAYYCFCSKERLEQLRDATGYDGGKYDRHCMGLSKEEVERNLSGGAAYVIRQIIPEGETTFHDEVYGDITISNDELDDQVLIKSDGLPTYNFANVIDDHDMEITHVVRGNEYLSSTPKYNLLYDAFGWEKPVYVHLPLVLNEKGEKVSKRKGDPSLMDLFEAGFLPEAVINFAALLGWSPMNNMEFFTLDELAEIFDAKGISKSPSTVDMKKLTWMNSEYIKKLSPDVFYEMALPYLKESIKRTDIDLKKLSDMTQSRVDFAKDVSLLVDFIDELPEYSTELFVHKKMKTTKESSLECLEKLLPLLERHNDWSEDGLHKYVMELISEMGIKNGQMLWPIRTALSGKPSSPCGATELAALLGKEDSLSRIKTAIKMLKDEL